ncbi:hypothetical protein [Streptosporangium sp. NPDC004631]
MRNTVLKAGVAVVMALLASTGCADTPGTSLTKREAMTIVNGYLRQTFQALPVKIAQTYPLEDVSSCISFDRRSTPTGQITPGVEHVTEVMGRRKGRWYLSAVAEYWSSRQATVRWQGDHSVEIRPFGDHYRLHLNYTPPPDGGQVSVMGGLDDCIWPDGTPPPEHR